MSDKTRAGRFCYQASEFSSLIALLIKNVWGELVHASYAGPGGKLLTDFLCTLLLYIMQLLVPIFVYLFFHHLFCHEGPSNN